MVNLLQVKPQVHEGWYQPYHEFLAVFLSEKSGRRIAIFEPDRWRFAGAFFAAIQTGNSVVLPSDSLPLTKERLVPLVDLWVSCASKSAVVCTRSQVQDSQAQTVTLFTSGSSGMPLAIEKSLNQLEREIDTLEHTFSERVNGSIVHSSVSHQHIYGLLFSILWPLAFGRSIAAHQIEFPEQLAATFLGADSIFISSPALLRRLEMSQSLQISPRAIFSSGGELPLDAAKSANRVFGVWVTEVYGSSETGGIAFRDSPTVSFTPFRDVSVRLGLDDQLEIQSAHLPTRDWFTTSDRVAIHRGSIALLGRVDRIVKVEEKRISLNSIEAAALSTGIILQAKAMLITRGSRTALGFIAQIESSQNLSRTALVVQLKSAISKVVEPLAIPKWFRFVVFWPQDAQGKTTEAVLTPFFHEQLPQVEWLMRGELRAELKLTIHEHLRVFHGHFIGTPIVPGVAQVDWVVHFARLAFGLPKRLQKIEVLKFQNLWRPPSEATLVMECKEVSRVTFRLSNTSGVFSSGRLIFEP